MKKNIIYSVLVLVGVSVGAYAQSKVSGIWIKTDGYANWGNTRGETGYGIRDNNGTMEYKNSGGGWGIFAAAGNPGGSNQQIQYNNSSVFGGVPITYDGTKFTTSLTGNPFWRFSPGSSPTTNNGYFEFEIFRAANGMPDPRPDDVFAIGWNISGAASGVGYQQLVMESHCADSTGCLDGIGQTETYFALDNGSGTQYRPIGMFQSANTMSPIILGYFNFDTINFYDRSQTNQILAMSSDSDGPGDVNFGTSILRSSVSNEDFLRINGSAAISFSKNGKTGLVLGADGNNVSLAPGGDGSAVVGVFSNNFQLANGNIYDASAHHRLVLQAGSENYYPSMSIGADEIGIKAQGSDSNIKVTLQSKGSGDITLDSAGTGNVLIQATGAGGSEIFLHGNNLGIWNGSSEVYGTTRSGTTCTITAIVKGIVTAASCT